MTYFADRTVYRVAFDDGPEVSLTVYPVYGKPDAVLRIRILQAREPIRVLCTVGQMVLRFFPTAIRTW